MKTSPAEIAAVSKQKQIPSLHRMLTYRRAHNSPGEMQFIKDYIMPLKPTIISTTTTEPMAFMVYVGESDIMFTSHVDTVHMMSKETHQTVLLKDDLYQKNDNQPLGADDAAGVWLMINMIHAEVPGIYAFFRGEERGGIGSSWCAKHRTDLFNDVQCAIAFDRRGTHSIITHQGAGRGCSDEFGRSLARILKMGHELDNTGIYTDTAEFFDLIPNCTNVSVGYKNEHSKAETLNKSYIEHLCKNVINADWGSLDYTPPGPDVGHTSYSPIGNSLFDPITETTPTDVADFLFDSYRCLPPDLHAAALGLAQKIYKRYEG